MHDESMFYDEIMDFLWTQHGLTMESLSYKYKITYQYLMRIMSLICLLKIDDLYFKSKKIIN
ncbi:hypothetical protein CAP47_02360 [Psychroflexus sp. S27]|nr:hypothetical protein CAP47_02360 [Psychroflexus sp. S27]